MAAPLTIHTLPLPTPFPVGPVNVYLVEDDPLTLIDSGVHTDEAWEALVDQLRALGFRLTDLDRLLTTHPHMDHYGQMHRIQAESGAPLWAHGGAVHELERAGTEDDATRRSRDRAGVFFRRHGVPDALVEQMQTGTDIFDYLRGPVAVARTLAEGDRVPFAGGALRVIHTPGHVPSHICFLDEASGTLVAGDHLLPDITPVPLLTFPTDPAEPKPRSLVDYVASIRKLFPFQVRRALGGHGGAVTDVPALYESYGLHGKIRTQKVLRFLQGRGPQTAYAVCCHLFPKLSPFEVYLGMSEAVGHLEVLEEEGRVVERDAGAHAVFAAAA